MNKETAIHILRTNGFEVDGSNLFNITSTVTGATIARTISETELVQYAVCVEYALTQKEKWQRPARETGRYEVH